MDKGPGPSKRVRYEDPEFEETVTKWFEEAGEDNSDIDICDKDEYEESNHNSDSELSAIENDVNDYAGQLTKDIPGISSSESEEEPANQNEIRTKKNITEKTDINGLVCQPKVGPVHVIII